MQYVHCTIIWKKKLYLSWNSWRILILSCRVFHWKICKVEVLFSNIVDVYLSVNFNHKSFLLLPYLSRSFSLPLSTVWTQLHGGLFSHMEKTVPAHCIAFPFDLSTTQKGVFLWLIEYHFSRSKKTQFQFKMVFCYQNCSDLLWEKIAWVIEKNLWNLRLKAENLQNVRKSLQTGQNNFWKWLVFSHVPGGFSNLIH